MLPSNYTDTRADNKKPVVRECSEDTSKDYDRQKKRNYSSTPFNKKQLLRCYSLSAPLEETHSHTCRLPGARYLKEYRFVAVFLVYIDSIEHIGIIIHKCQCPVLSTVHGSRTLIL